MPARIRGKEVAVGAAGMRARRDAGSAAQDHLVAHELAVVLTQGSGERRVAWIANIGTRRPLPHVAIELKKRPTVIRGRSSSRVKAPGFEEMPGELRRGGRLPLRFG